MFQGLYNILQGLRLIDKISSLTKKISDFLISGAKMTVALLIKTPIDEEQVEQMRRIFCSLFQKQVQIIDLMGHCCFKKQSEKENSPNKNHQLSEKEGSKYLQHPSSSKNQAAISCEICKDNFDLGEHLPMMICGNQHNCCKTCYKKILKSKLCPFCKQRLMCQAKKNRLLVEQLENQEEHNRPAEAKYHELELKGKVEADSQNLKESKVLLKLPTSLGQLYFHQNNPQKLTSLQSINLCQSQNETNLKETNQNLQKSIKRTRLLHQEEIDRLKQQFTQQHKKQEEAFCREIKCIKALLDQKFKHQSSMQENQDALQSSIEFMKVQLRSKEVNLKNRMKLIQQRERDLSQKEQDLAAKFKNQEERIRFQQKRLEQRELEFTKTIIQEKQSLYKLKQQLELQRSIMENEFQTKNKELSHRQQELQNQFQTLEQGKKSLQSMESQIVKQKQASIKELQREKERVNDLEKKLIEKLRIVEARYKQLCEKSRRHDEWRNNKNNRYYKNLMEKIAIGNKLYQAGQSVGFYKRN